jgi:hypothetical protein
LRIAHIVPAPTGLLFKAALGLAHRPRPGRARPARVAEAAGFGSLGTLDRLVYGNCEALVTLAAAAAVTERVRLVTDILIAPLRQTALLAKQAATVDRLSGGRLVLGLAVGGREDDYEDATTPWLDSIDAAIGSAASGDDWFDPTTGRLQIGVASNGPLTGPMSTPRHRSCQIMHCSMARTSYR